MTDPNLISRSLKATLERIELLAKDLLAENLALQAHNDDLRKALKEIQDSKPFQLPQRMETYAGCLARVHNIALNALEKKGP